jgi:3D (Asp-Asp-Asp) domain-containing protein
MAKNNPNTHKNNRKLANYSLIKIILGVLFLDLLIFPFPGSANHFIASKASILETETVLVQIPEVQLVESENVAKEPVAVIKDKKPLEIAYSRRFTMTAYNSEEAQCDSTPCITANGFNVCEHGVEDTVAANFLPFGTKIRVPELFGDKIFIVRDRMNQRYQERVDVWMLHKDNAIDFGVKYPLIEVLK